MILRRDFLSVVTATALVSFASGWTFPAWAESPGKVSAFVKQTGERLVAVVNGSGSTKEKRAEMTKIINEAVDVDGIARFCLGRFWHKATPQQQQEYVALFHKVLVTNITSKLGEYKGVTFTMGRTRRDGETDIVSTTVERPNNPPTAVDWVVADVDSKPQIIDVKAEGTSLRLTQRQDYASFLMHNGDNVSALIKAMKNQVS